MLIIIIMFSLIISLLTYYKLIKIFFKQNKLIYYWNIIYWFIFSILLSFIFYLKIENYKQNYIIILFLLLWVFLPFFISIYKYIYLKRIIDISHSIFKNILIDMLNWYLVYIIFIEFYPVVCF